MTTTEDIERRILVLGTPGLGSSGLPQKLSPAQNTNNANGTANHNDSGSSRQISVDGTAYDFRISEPLLAESKIIELSETIEGLINNTEAIVLWYPVTKRDAFARTKDLCTRVRTARSKTKSKGLPIALHDPWCPVFLIGVTSPEHLPSNSVEGRWQVTHREGEAQANELGCNGFFECSSAASTSEIEIIFANIVKEILRLERIKSNQRTVQRAPSGTFNSLVTTQEGAPSPASPRRATQPITKAELSNENRPITPSTRSPSLTRRTSMLFEKLRFGRKNSVEVNNSNSVTASPAAPVSNGIGGSSISTSNYESNNASRTSFSQAKRKTSRTFSLTSRSSMNWNNSNNDQYQSGRKKSYDALSSMSSTTSPLRYQNETGSVAPPPKIEMGSLNLSSWRDDRFKWPSSIIAE